MDALDGAAGYVAVLLCLSLGVLLASTLGPRPGSISAWARARRWSAVASGALLALLGAVALADGGGTDLSGKDRTYDTVEQLHEALAENGVTCEKDRVHHDYVPGVDTMTCVPPDLGPHLLAVWHHDKTPAEVRLVAGPFEYVEGPNWLVHLPSGRPAIAAERIRTAIGGTHHTDPP